MEMKAEICKMEILCKNKNKIGMVFSCGINMKMELSVFMNMEFFVSIMDYAYFAS